MKRIAYSTRSKIEVEKNIDPYASKSLRFYDKDDHYEVWLTGDFHGISDDEEMCDKVDFIRFVQDIKEADKSKEVWVYVNSYGGYLDGLLILINELVAFNHIVTICTAQAASCGLLLWALGNERYISPYAQLIYHEPSFGSIGKIDEVNDSAASTRERYDLFYKDINIEEIMTPEELTKGKTTEVYFTGAEMIKRGCAYPYSEFENRVMPPVVKFPVIGSYMFLMTASGLYKPVNFKKFLEAETKNNETLIAWSDVVSLMNTARICDEDFDKMLEQCLTPQKKAKKKAKKQETIEKQKKTKRKTTKEASTKQDKAT